MWLAGYKTCNFSRSFKLPVWIMSAMCDATLTQATCMCSWLYFISPKGNILHQSQLICKSADKQTTSFYTGTRSLAPTCQFIWFTVPLFRPVSIFHILSLLTFRCGSCSQELEVFWGGPDFIQGHMGAWSTRCWTVPRRLDQAGREQLQIRMFIHSFTFIHLKDALIQINQRLWSCNPHSHSLLKIKLPKGGFAAIP